MTIKAFLAELGKLKHLNWEVTGNGRIRFQPSDRMNFCPLCVVANERLGVRRYSNGYFDDAASYLGVRAADTIANAADRHSMSKSEVRRVRKALLDALGLARDRKAA